MRCRDCGQTAQTPEDRESIRWTALCVACDTAGEMQAAAREEPGTVRP